MYRKFACIEYIKNQNQIPLKFKILKKGPAGFLDWYVRKFNPFIIEDYELLGEKGFLVKLPVTREQANQDRELVIELMKKTVESLKDYKVDIVLPPDDIQLAVRIAEGSNLFAFFIMEAIFKSLELAEKNIKFVEILIIDGDRELTTNLLDRIYPHVNYLTILTSEENFDFYDTRANQVFSDTGLNLCVCVNNKVLVKDADIIINTSAGEDRYDFYYKRGAVYFELKSYAKKHIELAIKRDDLIIVDDLRLCINNLYMNLNLFEIVMFMKSKEYRSILSYGYDSHLGAQAKRLTRELGARVITLFFRGKIANVREVIPR